MAAVAKPSKGDLQAVAINEEHRLARQSAENAVEHAVRCGQLLIEKKAELVHGEFGKWIEQNCDFEYSTAARYIKAAKQISTGVEISNLRHLFPSGRPHVAAPPTELLPLPAGKYRCIVIDPPWPMEKIEREVAPNQVGFDYPTMDEEQLQAFNVADMADEACHLFCWTTHKHLPMALRLLEVWGFKYVCTMVWHKPGGFQPFGLPQYNCEFVLYARHGTPTFVETKQFMCCFDAARREHSRKPDEFYDVVRRVTAEPRIDVFSREPREGFAQYGNEIEKFAA